MESFRPPDHANVTLYSVRTCKGDRLLVNYPHALHSGHGPERPEGPQGSHCPEGLDPSSTKQGGSEVDERDLRLLVLLVF